MRHETQVTLVGVLGPLPAVVLAMVLLWTGDFSFRTQITVTPFVLIAWWIGVAALHRRIVSPLRTLANMLAALREGDYSLRARGVRSGDALGEVNMELNELGRILREQRLGAVETSALLRRVMEEIDVAIFAFDERHRLRLVNQRGKRLLGQDPEQLVGATTDELGLTDCFNGESPRLVEAPFRGSAGRWELRHGTFLERGLPQRLLVLSDLTRALREEERQAWQRLVHVLRHEVNNSLAPIHSLAETLLGILEHHRSPQSAGNLREGLQVISQRASSLNRFMAAYARLTRLPEPRPTSVRVSDWVKGVVRLDTRAPVTVRPGPDVFLNADADQLDQLLINLIRNAVDSALETGGGAVVGWRTADRTSAMLELWVEDEGIGIANVENLFVPFYTTKPEGIGIGLVLSRQIVEAHGGKIVLRNRTDGPGARAEVHLPLHSKGGTSPA